MKTAVGDGARVTVDGRQFGLAALEPTRRRGDDGARFAVAGRNRVEMRVGSWHKGDNGATVTSGAIGLDAFGGFGYTRYVGEDLAITMSVDSFGVDSGSSVGPNGVGAGLVGGWAGPIGIRWNPLRGDLKRQSLKPYLAVGVGPVVGYSEGSFVGQTISTGTVTRSTVGSQFGGGFDVHVARSVSLGVTVVYNWMPDFSEPVGLRKNYNGLQMTIGIGWLFGKGQ